MNHPARVAAILDHDHILRYCRPKQVDSGAITMSAFLLRPGEEFLSVNWLEYFGGITADAQVEKVRDDMRKSLKLSAGGRFARLNVGDVKKRVDGAGVKRRPEPENPSHAGIDIPENDRQEAAFALASLVKPEDVFPVNHRK